MTFDEQMTLNNAIYVIKYVFDLNNETTILPDNCVLKFIGGKLQNGNITFLNSKFVVGNVPSSSNKFVLNLKKGNGNLIVGHPFVIYLGNQNNTIDYNVFGYDINSQLPPSFITNITNNISGDMFFDKRLNTIVFYDGSNWRKLKAEAIEQI